MKALGLAVAMAALIVVTAFPAMAAVGEASAPLDFEQVTAIDLSHAVDACALIVVEDRTACTLALVVPSEGCNATVLARLKAMPGAFASDDFITTCGSAPALRPPDG